MLSLWLNVFYLLPDQVKCVKIVSNLIILKLHNKLNLNGKSSICFHLCISLIKLTNINWMLLNSLMVYVIILNTGNIDFWIIGCYNVWTASCGLVVVCHLVDMQFN